MKTKTAEKVENRFFTKTVFLTIQVDIWEVWGCPGAWHGPCKPITSNFGGIWSYMAWGKPIFMIFDILGKSLHHQMILGPPDGSLDLFLDTRGFWLNGLWRKSILKMTPKTKYFPGTWTTSQNLHCFAKWFHFLFFCWIFYGFSMDFQFFEIQFFEKTMKAMKKQ